MRRLCQLAALTLSLVLLAGCGTSPEDAREELASLNVEYTEDSFAQHAEEGDARAVKLFLTAGMKSKDDAMVSALEEASYEGEVEVVEMLLEANARPSENGLKGAISAESVDAVRMLLDGGADPNWAIYDAIDTDKPQLLKMLLDAGAKAEFEVRRYRRTPLLYAVMEGHSVMVPALLEAGADPNDFDGNGEPLYEAIRRRDARTVQRLLDAGADPNNPAYIYTICSRRTNSMIEGEIEQALREAGTECLE